MTVNRPEQLLIASQANDERTIRTKGPEERDRERERERERERAYANEAARVAVARGARFIFHADNVTLVGTAAASTARPSD